MGLSKPLLLLCCDPCMLFAFNFHRLLIIPYNYHIIPNVIKFVATIENLQSQDDPPMIDPVTSTQSF